MVPSTIEHNGNLVDSIKHLYKSFAAVNINIDLV